MKTNQCQTSPVVLIPGNPTDMSFKPRQTRDTKAESRQRPTPSNPIQPHLTRLCTQLIVTLESAGWIQWTCKYKRGGWKWNTSETRHSNWTPGNRIDRRFKGQPSRYRACTGQYQWLGISREIRLEAEIFPDLMICLALFSPWPRKTTTVTIMRGRGGGGGFRGKERTCFQHFFSVTPLAWWINQSD